MTNVWLALDGAWKVLVTALLLGAGLPGLFAVGMKSLAHGHGGSAEVDGAAAPHRLGTVVAGLCFALVLAVVILGIATIVASGLGMKVGLDGMVPTLVAK